MRIRLQLLLPAAVGLLVGAGFVLVANLVGRTVHEALLTVPGLTRDRAVEAAVTTVTLAGLVVTAVSVLLGLWLARMVVRPMRRMERAAHGLSAGENGTAFTTPVAELQDVARGLSQAAVELQRRHRRELREQAELAALVEAVSEGIIQVDGSGRIVRMNPASRALLGLPEDAVGRPVASLIRNAELRRVVERGARSGLPDAAEVVVDDQRVLVSVSPQKDGGAVATFVDLTDLRRLEEVRRDFVANASHELKTPLTSIRGYSETLLDADLPDAERKQFLRTIARNADRLQHIVDDLLDLSRLEAGRWEPDLETISITAAAESSWHAFSDRAERQRVSFSATAVDPDYALADRRALEQIFSNLYDNALRYTPEGGRIRVTARAGAEGPEAGARARQDGPARTRQDGSPTRRWVQVDVSDSGSGIPRESLPRIFERFYRVDPARSRAEGGTGLGLSIVKHMTESMGGSVRAESALGKGVTIRLWLPAAE